MSRDEEFLSDLLESEPESSPAFRQALSDLEQLAEDGSVSAADTVAEVFAFSKVHNDPAKAYFWYHVSLARQGYSTTFANRYSNLAQYSGASGDFRNEGAVSGLLDVLGEKRIRELDVAARKWLETHSAV